jgi:hypothetical protein
MDIHFHPFIFYNLSLYLCKIVHFTSKIISSKVSVRFRHVTQIHVLQIQISANIPKPKAPGAHRRLMCLLY